MRIEDYQDEAWQLALATAKNPSYLFSGLAGEAGEVASLYAKAVRDGYDMNKPALIKELGDVMWFVSVLCTYYSIPIEYVLEANIAKLNDRKKRGVLQGSGDDR